MSPLDIITLRAPQYSTDLRLSKFIELATMLTSDGFGTLKDMAIALRVLHMLTMESLRGGTSSNTGVAVGGIITSESEGQLSKSMAQNQLAMSRNSDLSATAYGLELMELVEMTFFKPRTRMMP